MKISNFIINNIWLDLENSIRFDFLLENTSYSFIPPLIGQNIAFAIGRNLNTYSTDINTETIAL